MRDLNPRTDLSARDHGLAIRCFARLSHRSVDIQRLGGELGIEDGDDDGEGRGEKVASSNMMANSIRPRMCVPLIMIDLRLSYLLYGIGVVPSTCKEGVCGKCVSWDGDLL